MHAEVASRRSTGSGALHGQGHCATSRLRVLWICIVLLASVRVEARILLSIVVVATVVVFVAEGVAISLVLTILVSACVVVARVVSVLIAAISTSVVGLLLIVLVGWFHIQRIFRLSIKINKYLDFGVLGFWGLGFRVY